MLVLIAIAAVIVLALWFVIFVRWQRGLYGLLLYLPFAGAVVLAMRPNHIPALLFKDIFFVIPTYLSFFVLHSREMRPPPIPPGVIIAMLFLTVLVTVQTMNPGIVNWKVAAVGVKVWLFYMPLIFIAAAVIDGTRTLIRLLRLLVVVAVIPCSVGLIQWFLGVTIGYQEAIEAFYGPAAIVATQGFSSFRYGEAYMRIPSTFSFAAQYFYFSLSMICPAYALMRIDTSRRWRYFGALTLALIIVATLLSGARASFVFVPFLLGLILLVEGSVSRISIGIVMVPIVVVTTLYSGGYDLPVFFGAIRDLMMLYSDREGLVVVSITDAIRNNPWGVGTGMNTGPARYVAPLGTLVIVESTYGKAIKELGLFGMIAVLAIFLSLIFAGLRYRRAISDPRLKTCAAVFVAFFIMMPIRALKGWPLDIDPVNVYFWVFAGIIVKLPYLQTPPPQSIGPDRRRIVLRELPSRDQGRRDARRPR